LGRRSMTSQEIRDRFTRYFSELDHQVVPSSPVIPAGDPTLLYTNAGMNQFKDVFLGLEERPYRRAVSVQKCIRAGGKHNDLELVGKTSRHLTFFEMLGNFSFGDYFKEEAIRYAWRFLTMEVGLRPERMWVSVFREDEESGKIWQKVSSLPSGKIYRMGEKDNFWSMGDTGPCGPCTEIGIDRGPDFGCGRSGCDVGCDCDRYLELWNLVFMQYSRDGAGCLKALPRPAVDTGMGLERIAAVLQGAASNFDTDLIKPLINRIEEITGIAYDGDRSTSFRVIADHIRMMVFAIVDGVIPSNEGRGYVLRRILRRASRHGRLLDIHEPFLFGMVDEVVEIMGSAYPELLEGRQGARDIIQGEEERFGQTLDQGLAIFEEVVHELGGKRIIPGEKAFLLYDTYGFPLDLTVTMAEERGLDVDQRGFEKEMKAQQERARGARERQDLRSFRELGLKPVEFTGYKALEGKGKVQRIEDGNRPVESAGEGMEVSIDLTSTPFYGESGGQLGDTGTLAAEGVKVRVLDSRKVAEGRTIHLGRIEEGGLRLGMEVEARVDSERRSGMMRSHTATHLLHYALRKVLGRHVRQAGSLVACDRFRFDFIHYSQMSPGEILEVEKIVQEKILANCEVSTNVVTFAEAKESGALAFFGEKYGQSVRVVDIGSFSSELCGGTHVGRTGDIGLFLNLSEGSISSGVRRIEALVGLEAFRQVIGQRKLLEDLSTLVKVPPEGLVSRVKDMSEEIRALRREVRDFANANARMDLKIDVENVPRVDGAPLFVRRVDVPDVDSMRVLADESRDRLGSGIIVLGAVVEGKAVIIVTVSADLVGGRGLDASRIVKKLGCYVGGGGGGRPDMAQAGGRRSEKLDEALEKTEGIIRELTGIN